MSSLFMRRMAALLCLLLIALLAQPPDEPGQALRVRAEQALAPMPAPADTEPLSRAGRSLVLAVTALALGALVGLVLGPYSAWRQRSGSGRMLQTLHAAGTGQGLLLALWAGWALVLLLDAAPELCCSGSSLWLPAVTLGLLLASTLSRLIATSILEALDSDYVRAARSLGLHPWQVLGLHVLPNALRGVCVRCRLHLGGILGGTLAAEMVFGWPGAGQLAWQALQARDLATLQMAVVACTLLAGALGILAEMFYLAIDLHAERGAGA